MRNMFTSCLVMAAMLVSTCISQLAAGEVTIKGMVLNNVHTGEGQTAVFVYALAGTPEISAEVDRIMAQAWSAIRPMIRVRPSPLGTSGVTTGSSKIWADRTQVGFSRPIALRAKASGSLAGLSSTIPWW